MSARLPGAAAVMTTHELSVRAGERLLVENLGLTVAAGEFIAVLGRNGSGKSLTLHTLAGLRAPAAGQIELAGTNLDKHGRRAIAQRLAFLPQDREDSLPLSPHEAALLARHPQLGWWQRESASDLGAVNAALQRFGLADCAHRTLLTLSGGEQRRAAMAATLAQQPQIFLLDEPTNHLDPHHQVDVLLAFRERCAGGAAVIATLHDPALAERCADRVLLLYGDGRWQLGRTAELLNAAELTELYQTPMTELAGGGRRAFIPA
jgi:iron complex transport system ATP-binding protein